MKNALEMINKILAEELDVIAEDKRKAVVKRIVDELKLDRLRFYRWIIFQKNLVLSSHL